MPNIIILINPAVPSISVGDYNGTTLDFASVSTSVTFIPSPTSPELALSTAQMGIGAEGAGRSVDFSFTDISVFEINGVNQIDPSSPIATNLQNVVDLCLAYCV